MTSSAIKRNSKIQHTVIETAPKATLLMLLAGLFILFIEAFFIQRLNSPAAVSAPFSVFALYFGAFFGGSFCAQRLEGGAGAACTLISSALICILLIAAKTFIKAPQTSNGFILSLISHLLIPICAFLGYFVGGRFKASKKFKKRKNHYRSKK